mmetsp:Transcript_75710/g.202622  ORF Transcript_75710/g.202622 Transcript_75710/m.202622 type:complete len:428 (+) Transcript_75710:366-1649(+)
MPQAAGRVAREQALEQRVYGGREPRRQRQLLAQNVVVQHLAVVVVEGVLPRAHLPRQRAQRPPVDLGAVRRLLQLLGRHVELRPGPRLGADAAALVADLGAAEVRHDEVALAVDEQVLGLEVAVHDAARVQLPQRQRHLPRVQHVRLGAEGSVVVQHVEELAAGEVVHDQVEPALALERVVHVDDVGVAHAREDQALVARALQVVLDDDVLAHALHGEHGAGGVLLADLEHLAEAALADHAEDLEVVHRDPRLDDGRRRLRRGRPPLLARLRLLLLPGVFLAADTAAAGAAVAAGAVLGGGVRYGGVFIVRLLAVDVVVIGGDVVGGRLVTAGTSRWEAHRGVGRVGLLHLLLHGAQLALVKRARPHEGRRLVLAPQLVVQALRRALVAPLHGCGERPLARRESCWLQGFHFNWDILGSIARFWCGL